MQTSPNHKAERRFLIEHMQLMAKGKQVGPCIDAALVADE